MPVWLAVVLIIFAAGTHAGKETKRKDPASVAKISRNLDSDITEPAPKKSKLSDSLAASKQQFTRYPDKNIRAELLESLEQHVIEQDIEWKKVSETLKVDDWSTNYQFGWWLLCDVDLALKNIDDEDRTDINSFEEALANHDIMLPFILRSYLWQFLNDKDVSLTDKKIMLFNIRYSMIDKGWVFDLHDFLQQQPLSPSRSSSAGMAANQQ